MVSWSLWYRKRVVVNTDPQRRCYDGCHFSPREEWTDWEPVSFYYASRENAESSAATFRQINPDRQYEVRPPTNL
jgi:hypothetical protein